MKKLLSEAKSTLQNLNDRTRPDAQTQRVIDSAPISAPTMNQPTPEDVIRYRYHHGTNLGSVFVLERWLSGYMFPGEPGGESELDAVQTHQSLHGLESTRGKWEAHWRDAVSDRQLEWLAKEAKCTSIRLPIGYFTLGPQWCQNTPFEAVASVYVHAWDAVREFTRRARGWGIGTLIDFHAVPGGANGEKHSGTSSGKADLWENGEHQNFAKRALRFIAEQVRSGALHGVIGIQLVNEATHNARGMYEWYEEVIREIGSVDESIPIYISDAWALRTCVEWVNRRNQSNASPRNPVIIDTHKYYTFSDFDRSQTPQEILARIPNELSELNNRHGTPSNQTEAQVIVGEWSCVLDTKSWSRLQPSPEQRAELIRQFGRSQSEKWQEKAGGSYFWTFKMDWMPGGEWGFEEQTNRGNISHPKSFLLPPGDVLSRVQAAHERREQLAVADRTSHEKYWDATSPGQRFEHHLYGEGWAAGYSDALHFFKMRAEGHLGENARTIVGGGDRIGCLEAWAKKRLMESGVRGEFVWEWEQGFRKGVAAFYGVVGV